MARRFIVDHSFLFLIRENGSGSILFLAESLIPRSEVSGKNDFGRAVSRILSAPSRRRDGGENHLSQQPIPETCPLSRTRSGPLLGLLFGLAPDGVFRAVPLAQDAVVSYTTFHPYPSEISNLKSEISKRRFDFLWHCPSGSLTASPPACIPAKRARLRGIAPLVFGLSSSGVHRKRFSALPKSA